MTPNSENSRRPLNIILAIIATIAILTVLICYTFIQQKNIINNAEQVTNQLVEHIAENISNEIGYAKSSIKLSALSVAQTMTSNTLENPAEVIRPMIDNTPFGGIEYIRPDGMNIMNIGEPFDASDRVYYIEGIQGNTGIWNNYHPKTSQETLMNFYTPLIYNGEISGVITGYIAASTQIAPLFETTLYGQDILGLLVDENNMVICSTIESEYVKDQTLDMFMERFVPTTYDVQNIKSLLDKSTISAVTYKGKTHDGRMSTATIPGTQWKVVIIVPASSVRGIIGEFSRNSLVTIAIVTLIIALYASYILLNNYQKRKEISAQKSILQDEKNEYYSTLSTLEGIFYSMHVINLTDDTVIEFNSKDQVKEIVNHKQGAVEMMLNVMSAVTVNEYKASALEFTDLTTLADRMKDKKIISKQFVGIRTGWFLASFITMEKDENGRPTKVIYTTRVIDEEKKQEEMLIQKAETDELTGLLNRRAYEEDIYAHNDTPDEDKFIYISLDVNGLKVVNDTKGHMAGDELIIGACQCMKKCLGPYGKLYRIGGDEFVAILMCDENELKAVLADFDNTIATWSGKLIDRLSISYGWINKEEDLSLSVRQLGAIAEQRMYDAKDEHYRKEGVDRRGQKDAHKALCDLYTKILKVNITDDTYQIVNMDISEQTASKGFTDTISGWLKAFGESGQVHPEDLAEYLKRTDIQYMRDYFAGNKTSLNVFYRRKYEDVFKQVMMEIIPANDYTAQNQSLFLYVKNIDL